MRKIYALFLTLFIGLSVYANPIPLPTIEISELYFDEFNNWNLELGYYWVNTEGLGIDSVFLFSTTDTIKLPSFNYNGSTGVIVITTESLDTEFHIKRYADTIKINYYLMGQAFEDVLIYGELTGACINYPRQGQSISRFWNCFFKDNSPTIGFANDTLGMCGTITGIVYDINSEVVPNRTFRLDNYSKTSEYGEYSVRTYSKPSKYSQIYFEGQYSSQYVPITEISYVMEPDSVIELNIYLLDTLKVGINYTTLENSPISISPNPVSINEMIKLRTDLPVITSNMWLEIIDLNGKLIKKEKIKQNEILTNPPAKAGIYVLRILLDSQMISSKRIIVNE